MSFVKRSNKSRTVRKRSEDQLDDEEDSTVVVKKQKTTANNPNFSSTTSKKKPQSQDDEGSGSLLSARQYSSDRGGSQNTAKDLATATLETETPHEIDARAIYERSLKESQEGEEGEEGQKKYKGMNAYHNYLEKNERYSGGAGGGAKGPVRAPLNVRQTSRFDYQPDICKDYYETGYCGYGLNCKFAHIREDYKSGWQLEKEFEEEQRKQKLEAFQKQFDEAEEKKEEEDDLPFACHICREPFEDPVVTKCKHYFCEKCAYAHWKKSPKCYICGAQTNGIFNTAFDIIKKMEKVEAKGLALKRRHVEDVNKRAMEGKSEPITSITITNNASNSHSDSEEEETNFKPKEKNKFTSSAGWSIPHDFAYK